MGQVPFEETTQVLQNDALYKPDYFKSHSRKDGAVKSVNFLSEQNAGEHQTKIYRIVTGLSGTVLRRGQSFKLKIWLNDDFKFADDNLQLEFYNGTNPSEDKGTQVTLKVKDSENFSGDKWNVRVANKEAKQLTLEVKLPPNCTIGIWRMSAVTQPGNKAFDVKEHFYIIFNPFCKDDAVYMEDEKLRNEYAMNDEGKIFCFSNEAGDVITRNWNYFQFMPCALPAAIYFLEMLENKFDKKIDKSSPISVTRFLTFSGNKGTSARNSFTIGNWEGNWSDEEDPTHWIDSQAILEKYMEHLKPVCYSQCWVFAAITCTVCRAIGIPCRVVTNFSSAHDKNGNLTIDSFFEQNVSDEAYFPGESDSVWNFHVWNDAWMTRPDLPDGYGGWQAIDACPQEVSRKDDMWVCGPSPLKAIKNGDVDKLYDTPFIYSEVNADWNKWVKQDDGSFKLVDILKNKVGTSVLTKGVGEDGKEDLVLSYKYKEGDDKERQANKHAAEVKGVKLPEVGEEKVSTMAAHKPLPKKEVRFYFIPVKMVMIGEPIIVCGVLENKSDKKRTIKLTLGANSILYTGAVKHKLNVSGKGDPKKMTFTKTVELLPGQKEINAAKFAIGEDKYLNFLVGLGFIRIYASGVVKETKQILLEQDTVAMLKPKLTVLVPNQLKVKVPCTIKLEFTNPLKKELKKCSFYVSTNCTRKGLKIKFRNVKPKEKVVHEVKITPLYPGKCSVIARFTSDILTDVIGRKATKCIT